MSHTHLFAGLKGIGNFFVCHLTRIILTLKIRADLPGGGLASVFVPKLYLRTEGTDGGCPP